MYGLGKSRSKLGKWLDLRGIKQDWLVKKSKVSKATISIICSDDNYIPSGTTIQKVLKVLREVDPNLKADDFWSM